MAILELNLIGICLLVAISYSILHISYCLFTTTVKQVGTRFLHLIQWGYIKYILWQAVTMAYLLTPETSLASPILMASRLTLGVFFTVATVFFNMALLDGFQVITNLTTKWTMLWRIGSVVNAVCASMFKILHQVDHNPIEMVGYKMATGSIALYGTILNISKSLIIMQGLYKDTLTHRLPSQQSQVTRQYRIFTIELGLLSVLDVSVLIAWGVGLVTANEPLLSLGQCLIGIPLTRFAPLICKFRKFRFNKSVIEEKPNGMKGGKRGWKGGGKKGRDGVESTTVEN